MIMLLAVTVAATGLGAGWATPASEEKPADLVSSALSKDPTTAAAARKTLRNQGPDGFRELWRAKASSSLGNADARDRLDTALDEVGGARYSSISGLYWHTDLEKALAESKRSGRPVLSLRMLGKLTDEYSCANSRFFRTALYAAPEIATRMQRDFVLHWRTIRPAPVMTIDFGDGRVLKRTITGNSAHYLLSSDGKVLDILPGMYAPSAFETWLRESRELSVTYESQEAASRDNWLQQHHAARLRTLNGELETERIRFAVTNRRVFPTPAAGPNLPTAASTAVPPAAAQPQVVKSRNSKIARRPTTPQAIAPTRATQESSAKPDPRAIDRRFSDGRAAAEIAMPKRAIERPLVSTARLEREAWVDARSTGSDDAILANMAATRPELRELNAITAKILKMERAAATHGDDEADRQGFREEMLKALGEAVANDSIRNEYKRHLRVHTWFSLGQAGDIEEMDRRVYDELFEMPFEDRWMGLVPRAAYTALEANGWVEGSDP